MPEVRFTILWPDGGQESCYSPSTAITHHLEPGASYPLAEFLTRARAGLSEASGRVEAKYGYFCASAMDQLSRIELRAALQMPSGQVTCLAMSSSPQPKAPAA